MNDIEDLIGKTATLKTPYKGYSRVKLIAYSHYKWTIEICGSGKWIEVYEDDFELD